MQANSKLNAALSLAARGLPVFPIKENSNEQPLVAFASEATTDAAIIERWWRERPRANVAVHTSGLLVLDVDAHKGGVDALKFLCAVNDDLPPTFTVATPRGGAHLYYAVDLPVQNSQSKLGQGLDVRGWHGYVAAPGSTRPEGEYTITQDAPIARAPQWLIDLAGAPVERKAVAQAIEELDSEHATKRAVDWLKTAAPLAIQGDAGDATTYQVAARLLDFGLSPDGAYEAMQEHWNERCSPPWSPEELERKIGNAAKYRQTAIGSRDPRADFDAVDVAESAPPAGAPGSSPDKRDKLSPPTPFVYGLGTATKRDWIVPGLMIRGKISEVIAPAGVGKSTFTLALAAAIASGKSLTGHQIPRRGRVWLYNNEDDRNELQLRVDALIVHHGLAADDLPRDRFFLDSGERRPFLVARRMSGGQNQLLQPADGPATIEYIREQGITALIVDPFAETHEGAENDNMEMLRVARMYRQIAQEGNCAVMLVHHTRKPPAGSSEGHAGNMDSGRGASALPGVARVVVTLYGMSEKDAKKHGVAIDDRGRYVRLDDAKANLSLGSGKARWFRRTSVDVPAKLVPVREYDALPEQQASTGMGREEVGVLVPVDLVTVSAERGDLAISGQAAEVWACATALADVGERVTRKALSAEYDRRIAAQPGRQMSAEARKKAVPRAIKALEKRGWVKGTKDHVLVLVECPAADDPFMSPKCPAEQPLAESKPQKSAEISR